MWPVSVSDVISCIQIASVLIFLRGGIHYINALKCYTCGETNAFLGLNYTNLSPLSCRDFESSNPETLQKYIIECPSDYLGCITQSQGDVTIRTCDTFAIDDCQTANGITYCYCNYDFCNGKNALQTKTQHHIHDAVIDDVRDDELDILSDDEDYTEMSGFGHIKSSFDVAHVQTQSETVEDTTQTTITITKPTTVTSNTLVIENSSTTETDNSSLVNSTTTVGIDTTTMPTTTTIPKNSVVNSSTAMKIHPIFQCCILVFIIVQLFST